MEHNMRKKLLNKFQNIKVNVVYFPLHGKWGYKDEMIPPSYLCICRTGFFSTEIISVPGPDQFRREDDYFYGKMSIFTGKCPFYGKISILRQMSPPWKSLMKTSVAVWMPSWILIRFSPVWLLARSALVLYLIYMISKPTAWARIPTFRNLFEPDQPTTTTTTTKTLWGILGIAQL